MGSEQAAMTTLESMVEGILAMAREIIFKEGGQVYPMGHAVDKDGQGHLGIMELPEFGDKFAALRQFLQVTNPAYVTIALESWVTTRDKADPNVVPSEDPKRGEAIVIIQWEIGSKPRIRIARIDREAKTITLDSDPDFDMVFGNLIEVLRSVYPWPEEAKIN